VLNPQMDVVRIRAKFTNRCGACPC